MNPIHKTFSFHSQIKLASHCQYRASPFLPQRWLPDTIFWSKSCKPPRIRISCPTRVFCLKNVLTSDCTKRRQQRRARHCTAVAVGIYTNRWYNLFPVGFSMCILHSSLVHLPLYLIRIRWMPWWCIPCSVRHYCIAPRSINTGKLTAIIKAAAKVRLLAVVASF